MDKYNIGKLCSKPNEEVAGVRNENFNHQILNNQILPSSDFQNLTPNFVVNNGILQTNFVPNVTLMQLNSHVATQQQTSYAQGISAQQLDNDLSQYVHSPLDAEVPPEISVTRSLSPTLSVEEGYTWTRSSTVQFIRLLKLEPCLWLTTHPGFRNKRLRMDAINRIITAFDFRIDVHEATKKIHTIKTQYRKEVNLIRKSKRSQAEQVYKPTLYFFNELKFLEGDGFTQCECRSKTREQSSVEQVNNDEIEKASTSRTVQDMISSVPPEDELFPARKKLKNDPLTETIELTMETIKEINERYAKIDHFAIMMGERLGRLGKRQRQFAEILVMKVISLSAAGELTSQHDVSKV